MEEHRYKPCGAEGCCYTGEPSVPVRELEELIETKSFRPKVGSKAVRVYRLQKLIDKAKGDE